MEHPERTIFLILLLLLYLFAVLRFILRYFGPVKTVAAELIDLQRAEFDAPRAPEGKLYRCSVTFMIGQERKSFYVTEEKYSAFRLGQKGTLTYRGQRLVDFHE